jgi:NAD(P)H-nitrite reductase large subunit
VRIDRCICHKATFAAMLAWRERHPKAGFEELQREFRCGTGCGLCAPYVRRALRTGATVFHQIVTDRDEPPAG